MMEHAAAPKSRGHGWAVCLALGLLATTLLIAVRLLAVRAAYGDYMGCSSCLDQAVIVNDLRPLAVLVCLFAAAWLSRRWWWRLPLVLAAVTLLSLYAIDQGVFLIFGFRLKVSDFFRYAGDTGAAWSVVSPLIGTPRGLALLGGWALGSAGWTGAILLAGTGYKVAVGGAALAAAMGGAAPLLTQPDFVMPESYRDFISNNLPSGVDQPFSPAFRQALAAKPAPTSQCSTAAELTTGADEAPRSVILLVVESLSAYHSALFSGIGHSTPELDRLALANSYFPDFHANGFTTDGGLIALLTGRVPLPAAGRYQSAQAYAGYESTLEPEAFPRLRQAGYQTGFFTTGDLSFLDKGAWLTALGIGHVEGSGHPFYAALPRGPFHAAGDQALYDRYLDWYDHERTTHQPLFSTLLTVSTHPPFHVPGTGIADEVQAFQWVDAQIGRFVQALDDRDYFKHGILVVTGDHRTMTVVRPAERQRFGVGAVSRVPAVVIGPAGLPPGAVPGRWQQADFLAGLMDVARLPSCTEPFRGRLLGERHAPAAHVMHVHGVLRDHVLVWDQTSAEPRAVEMNGDHTAWLAGQEPPAAAGAVIDQINRERARLAPVPNDLIELILRSR